MTTFDRPQGSEPETFTNPLNNSVSTNEQLAFFRAERTNLPTSGPTSFLALSDTSFSPASLLGGRAAADQPVVSDTPPPAGQQGAGNPAQARAEIQSLILGGGQNLPSLGSDVYREREQATQQLFQTGLAAVPQLLAALDGRNPQTGQPLANRDLEIETRSERLIRRILDERVDTAQLLSFRDEQTRNQFLEQSLGRQPSEAERTRFTGAVDAAIARRLTPGDMQNGLAELSQTVPNGDSGRKMLSGFAQPVSDRALALADRLATPQGQAQLWQEIDRLRVIQSSQNATQQERSNAADQIRLLTTGLSPTQVENMRVYGRLAQAEHLAQNPFPGSQDTANAQVLAAYRLATTDTQRQSVLSSIAGMGLDQNAAFMTAFVAAGGNRQAAEQAGQAHRDRMARFNQLMNGPAQGGAPIVPPPVGQPPPPRPGRDNQQGRPPMAQPNG